MRKHQAKRNKSRMLTEDSQNMLHNKTEIPDGTESQTRPDSDISFPSIPSRKEKYSIDREKLSILKSQRDSKKVKLKLEHSQTNDNILLLNNLQLRVSLRKLGCIEKD